MSSLLNKIFMDNIGGFEMETGMTQPPVGQA